MITSTPRANSPKRTLSDFDSTVSERSSQESEKSKSRNDLDQENSEHTSKLNSIKLGKVTPFGSPKSFGSVPRLIHKHKLESNKKPKTGSPLRNEINVRSPKEKSLGELSRNFTVPTNLSFIKWYKYSDLMTNKLVTLKNKLILKRFVLLYQFNQLISLINYYCLSVDKYNNKINDKFKSLQVKAKELVDNLIKL